MDTFESDLERELEALGEVRDNFLAGLYTNRRLVKVVERWLRHKEDARLNSALERTESREERALLIADNAVSQAALANLISERALDSARKDLIVAIIAVVIAAIATAPAIINMIMDYLKNKKP